MALMGTEGITLDLTEDAIAEIAKLAHEVNSRVENIGARRLQTVMEKLLEEVSFTASDRGGETVAVDAAYVATPGGRPRGQCRSEQVHPVGLREGRD